MNPFYKALPFTVSFICIPLIVLGAVFGGWWLALVPLYGWYAAPVIDALVGRNLVNQDPDTDLLNLKWYRLVTLIWFPIQATTLVFLLWYVASTSHLSLAEELLLFLGFGIISGSIGIVFAH